MSRKTTTVRAGQDRASLYDEITGKIIAELEAGRTPLGSALGNGGGEGTARHAEERRDRQAFFRDQCADPLGCRCRTRLSRPKLAHLPPGAGARRQCSQGRARHDRRLYRPLPARRREPSRPRECEDAQAIPFLKRFTVFNAAQCENLPDDIAIMVPPPPGLIASPCRLLCFATRLLRTHSSAVNLASITPSADKDLTAASAVSIIPPKELHRICGDLAAVTAPPPPTARCGVSVIARRYRLTPQLPSGARRTGEPIGPAHRARLRYFSHLANVAEDQHHPAHAMRSGSSDERYVLTEVPSRTSSSTWGWRRTPPPCREESLPLTTGHRCSLDRPHAATDGRRLRHQGHLRLGGSSGRRQRAMQALVDMTSTPGELKSPAARDLLPGTLTPRCRGAGILLLVERDPGKRLHQFS
jgi:hypothetical protein